MIEYGFERAKFYLCNYIISLDKSKLSYLILIAFFVLIA